MLYKLLLCGLIISHCGRMKANIVQIVNAQVPSTVGVMHLGSLFKETKDWEVNKFFFVMFLMIHYFSYS